MLNRFLHRKNGQIEIMGLLLIIVLFAFGILLALYFVLSPSDTSVSQQVKESIIAGNTITSMRKTTTTCFERTVEELLEDCARTGGALQCPSGASTCNVAETVITEILDLTFDELQRDYYFTIEGATYFDSLTFGQKCPGALESKQEPVPVGVGFDILLTLDICR